MQLKATGILTPEQIQAIEVLVDVCTAIDGNSVPIYRHLLENPRPFPCNILAYEGQHLIGFVRAFFFTEYEVEVSIMVAPDYRRQGIATAMFRALVPVIQSQYINELKITTAYGLHDKWMAVMGFQPSGLVYQMHYQPQSDLHILPLTGAEIIRRATINDLPYLTAIHRSGFPTESSEIQEYLEMLVTDANHQIFILVAAGLPVAKAHIRFQGNDAYLADIAVFPKHQSKGYARALIKHCLQVLHDTHSANIFLDLEHDNPRAQKIYRDLGFSVVNTHQCWSVSVNFREFNLTDFLQHL